MLLIRILFVLNIMMACNKSFAQPGIKHGTTVVMILYKDTVWLGADSKMTYLDDSTRISSECKLYAKSGFYFTFTGVYSAEEIGCEPFNAKNDLLSCIKPDLNIDSIKEHFNKLATGKLNLLLANLKNRNYELYKKLNTKFLESLLITFVNGKPIIRHWEYNIDKQNGNMSISDAKDFGFILAGTRSDIIDALIKNRNLVSDLRPSDAIEKLIMIQAEATPHAVGPPIVIFEITANGFRQVKGVLCREN